MAIGEPITVDRRAMTETQIAETLDLVREVLGPDLVGAYLYGSSMLGGLQPPSDVDILVVSRRATTHDDKLRLADRMLAISDVDPRGTRRPIELTIVVHSDIRPWRYPPSFDFQYGDWMRHEFAGGNVEPWPSATNPDLASLCTMVLLTSRPLLGPAAADVLDPVPRDDYLSAITGEARTLVGELGWDARNVALTLARVWSTLATDRVRSKDAAAAWTIAKLPPEY